MSLFPAGLAAVVLLFLCDSAAQCGVIRSITAKGTKLPVTLEIHEGDAYDPAAVQREVKRLWKTGGFDDIRVEKSDQNDIVFHLVERERFYLRDWKLEPGQEPLPEGMKLELQKGVPIDHARAQTIAGTVRERLAEHGYGDARVDAALTSAGDKRADLRVLVDAGPQWRVSRVEFEGDLGLDPRELSKNLRATRTKTMLPRIPGLFKGWRSSPNYTEGAVTADLTRLRSLYLLRGYFDAFVQTAPVTYEGDNVAVKYKIAAGPRYQIRNMLIDDQRISGPATTENLCRTLIERRRIADSTGRLDFSARLDIKDVEPGRVADLSVEIDEGRQYTINRIEFRGHHSVSDITLRRMMLLDEGEVMDQTRLRKSLAQINRWRFFQPIDHSSVSLVTNPETGRADVTINLKEDKLRRWAFSGPVGPISVGGPLKLEIASRLPAWGRGPFELATYYVSFNLLGGAFPFANLLPFGSGKFLSPLLTLQRPMMAGQPWLSGFNISPQFSWQQMLIRYAATQAKGPLLSRFGFGGKLPEPPLYVPVNRNQSTLVCEEKSRFGWLSNAAGMAQHYLMSGGL